MLSECFFYRLTTDEPGKGKGKENGIGKENVVLERARHEPWSSRPR